MKKLLFIFLIVLTSCDKEEQQAESTYCSVCTSVVTVKYSGDRSDPDETYSEIHEEGNGCAQGDSTYEAFVDEMMQDHVDTYNSHNPHMDIDLATFEITNWTETYSFTLVCD